MIRGGAARAGPRSRAAARIVLPVSRLASTAGSGPPSRFHRVGWPCRRPVGPAAARWAQPLWAAAPVGPAAVGRGPCGPSASRARWALPGPGRSPACCTGRTSGRPWRPGLRVLPGRHKRPRSERPAGRLGVPAASFAGRSCRQAGRMGEAVGLAAQSTGHADDHGRSLVPQGGTGRPVVRRPPVTCPPGRHDPVGVRRPPTAPSATARHSPAGIPPARRSPVPPGVTTCPASRRQSPIPPPVADPAGRNRGGAGSPGGAGSAGGAGSCGAGLAPWPRSLPARCWLPGGAGSLALPSRARALEPVPLRRARRPRRGPAG